MLASEKAARGGPGIGGVGLHQGPRDDDQEFGGNSLGKLNPEDKAITGLNRPNSAGSARSNNSNLSKGSNSKNSHRANVRLPIK